MSSTRGNTRKTQKAADPTTPLGQPFLAGVVKEEAESVNGAMPFLWRSGRPITVAEAEEHLARHLTTGDLISAECWADWKFAIERANLPPSDAMLQVKVATFVQDLTRVGRYERVCAFLDKHNLIDKHILFAYYYCNALAQRRLWAAITTLPIGHLVSIRETPLPTSKMPTTGGRNKGRGDILPQEKELLEEITVKLKIESALLVVLGDAFLHTENRAAATECLTRALLTDPACFHAEHLIRQHNLVQNDDEVQFRKLQRQRYEENGEAAQVDPREQTILALRCFNRGDAHGANQITTAIIEEFGLYQDALLVHISSLVQLKDSERLFLLAHRLVDAMPDSEISWYAVALYYFVCKKHQAAKSFMNKATAMNEGFCEGWLAFGHILASDCEHEQAMNCYLRATRVQDRHFEPLLYIAMGHCYTNNVKLAADFLGDAAKLAPRSPIVAHEQGTLAYIKKDYEEAERLFERALCLVADLPSLNKIPAIDLLNRSFDPFWEPLINNLGHVARRLHKYNDAIKYHQKALLMVPRKVTTISSLGMSYACLRDFAKAVQYFQQALAIRPFNSVMRSALDKLIIVMGLVDKNRARYEKVAQSSPPRSVMTLINMLNEGDDSKANKLAMARKIEEGLHRKVKERAQMESSAENDRRLGNNQLPISDNLPFRW